MFHFLAEAILQIFLELVGTLIFEGIFSGERAFLFWLVVLVVVLVIMIAS